MNKKVLMAAILSVVCAASAMAQKTTEVISLKETQARLLDVMSNAYVRPLTVELQVDNSKGRIRDQWELTGAELSDLGVISSNGTIELSNLRSYGVYKSAQKHNCDVIVAATFNFETTDLLNGGTLEVVGYPANFINWKTADDKDLEWIRMEKVQTTSERDRLNAIVK